MIKRILCILILLCVLLPAVIACSKNNGYTDQSMEDTEVDTSGSDTEDFAPTPYMNDFESFNFNVLTRGSGSFTSNDITGELTGDKLSQATYKRNQTLKSKYNFNIVEFKEKDWVTTAQTVAAAGEDTYHMWSFKLRDYASLILNGYLLDMNKINIMEIDAPYYDQTLRTQGSYANMLFFITGDMLYMDDLSVMSLCFNKDMWDRYKLSDIYGKNLYELVDSGEWTFEKYVTLNQKFGFDSDGDGDVDENDTLGQMYASQDILQLNVGIGNSIISKDSDDLFVFNDSEKQKNDIDKIFDLLRSDSFIYQDNYTSTAFHDSRALFLGATLKAFPGKVETFAGMIPHPKYDETQENYNAFIHPHASNAIAIPSAVVEVDKVANIIDLISYESMSTLTPEITEYLYYGLPDSDNDRRMTEIICRNKSYDLSYTWHIDYGFEALRTMLEEKSDRTASLVLSEGKSQIDATNKSYFNSMMRQ